jgi:hypothetical protein
VWFSWVGRLFCLVANHFGILAFTVYKRVQETLLREIAFLSVSRALCDNGGSALARWDLPSVVLVDSTEKWRNRCPGAKALGYCQKLLLVATTPTVARRAGAQSGPRLAP